MNVNQNDSELYSMDLPSYYSCQQSPMQIEPSAPKRSNDTNEEKVEDEEELKEEDQNNRIIKTLSKSVNDKRLVNQQNNNVEVPVDRNVVDIINIIIKIYLLVISILLIFPAFSIFDSKLFNCITEFNNLDSYFYLISSIATILTGIAIVVSIFGK